MSIPTSTTQYYLSKAGPVLFDNIKQRTVPLPPLKNGEVLVKIHAVSLQFRDIMVASPNYPRYVVDELVPGSDMAGEVIAVGQDVQDSWKIGDRVSANFVPEHLDGDTTPAIMSTALGGATHGVLTEYKSFKPESLVAIPAHLSYEEASTLPCAAVTAYNALTGAKPVKAGDTVLILGTGGVSFFGLQFAVASGATVIVTSSSDDKLALAKKHGATHLINYNKTPEWEKEVLKLTNGVGVDHVLEVSGVTLGQSVQAVRMGGTVNIIGVRANAGAKDNFGDIATLPYQVIMKAATLRGIMIGSVAQFKAMNRLISAHPETTRPVVDKVFPFSQTVEAFKYLNSQKHVGKVVISLEK